MMYFEFTPAAPYTNNGGVLSTPLTGDVRVGDIVAVFEAWKADALVQHPDWTQRDKAAYDAQHVAVHAPARESASEPVTPPPPPSEPDVKSGPGSEPEAPTGATTKESK